MGAAGAVDLDTFAVRAFGHGEAALASLGLPEASASACRAALQGKGDLRAAAGTAFDAWVSAARLRNTESYVERALQDPRYAAARNSTPPKKVGSSLTLFDCLTCDKCIPVCPNDANFALPMPKGALALERLVPGVKGFALEALGETPVDEPHQIANFADACNECGHCDVMCPEDGGPYVVKPRFFGSVEAWGAAPTRDGFALERTDEGIRMHGRFGDRTFVVESGGGPLRYRGAGFDLRLDLRDPAGTARGQASGPVDLGFLRIMERLREAVTAPEAVNFVSAALSPFAPARPRG
jgi:putative selenate reductase